MKKVYIALFVVSIENLKNLNIIHLRKNSLLFAVSARMKMKKYLKNKSQLRY